MISPRLRIRAKPDHRGWCWTGWRDRAPSKCYPRPPIQPPLATIILSRRRIRPLTKLSTQSWIIRLLRCTKTAAICWKWKVNPSLQPLVVPTIRIYPPKGRTKWSARQGTGFLKAELLGDLPMSGIRLPMKVFRYIRITYEWAVWFGCNPRNVVDFESPVWRTVKPPDKMDLRNSANLKVWAVVMPEDKQI